MIPMPSRPWPIWAALCALLVTSVPVNLFYWDQVLRTGLTPEEEDTAILMLFGLTILPLLISPILLFLTYFCVQRYDSDGGLLVWRPDRPVRSTLLTFFLGVPAAALVAMVVTSMIGGPEWYDLLWMAWALACGVWLLMLRAAGISQQPAGSPDAETFS